MRLIDFFHCTNQSIFQFLYSKRDSKKNLKQFHKKKYVNEFERNYKIPLYNKTWANLICLKKR